MAADLGILANNCLAKRPLARDGVVNWGDLADYGSAPRLTGTTDPYKRLYDQAFGLYWHEAWTGADATCTLGATMISYHIALHYSGPELNYESPITR